MNIKRIKNVLLIIGVIATLVTSAFALNDDDGRRKIVGTWVCDVAEDPTFRALQTFHADGTFTETSSDLAKLVEGPAHGVWRRAGDEYLQTFQLFAFDPETHESTGMIRVSIRLQLDRSDRLKATFRVVEFIDPNGVISELDRGPQSYPCTRVKVMPVP